MNKIFKVIWSKVRGCYIVASELANGNTKAGTPSAVRKARRSAAGLCALQIALLSSFIAFAPMNDAFAAVEAGTNIVVAGTEENPIVSTASNVTFTSVTSGTVTLGTGDNQISLTGSNGQLNIGSSGSVRINSKTYISNSGFNANTQKITNVLAGTAATDAVNFEQLTTTNTNVTNLTSRVTTAEGKITTNTNAITALGTRMTTAENTLKYFKIL